MTRFPPFADRSWPATPAEAVPVQQELRQQVRLTDDAGPTRLVAGVDVSHKNEESRCAIAVLDAETLAVVESVTAIRPMTFPYVPGFLSFRELPVALDALALLKNLPDLLMVDESGRRYRAQRAISRSRNSRK